MALQVLSVVGAILILGAFGGLQTGRLPSRSLIYQWSNLFGGLALVVVAVADQRIGFILLEGAWVIMSVIGLIRLRTGREA